MPGIGDVTARAMMESMAERGWDPDAFAHFAPPPRARDAHRDLVALLRRLRSARAATRAASAKTSTRSARSTTRCSPSATIDAEPRLADLDQLRVIAAGYPNRGAFLAALALEPPAEHAGSRDRQRVGGRRARHQHRPQREGQGVGRGVRHLGRGRLVPVVALARRRGAARGGAAPHVRRDDARAKSSRGHVSAQRLRHATRLTTTRSISSRASSIAACARRCSASCRRSRGAAAPSPNCRGTSRRSTFGRCSEDGSRRCQAMSAGYDCCTGRGAPGKLRDERESKTDSTDRAD